MVARQIFRVPMSIFDQYRGLCLTSPRLMNFYMMNMIWISFLFLGKGVEKLALYSGENFRYESFRRARRFYIPYCFASYQFRFPVNKWLHDELNHNSN